MGLGVLLRVHEYLSELFLRHQESLIQLDIETALERLDWYRWELAAHMEAEEQVLLPVYQRAGAIPGGPPECFIGEHERMRQFLARFASALEAIQTDQTDLLHQVILVLDEVAAYKSLIHHHDQRERNLLFPALDRVTTEDERRELLEVCLAANGMDEGAGAQGSTLRLGSRKSI